MCDVSKGGGGGAGLQRNEHIPLPLQNSYYMITETLIVYKASNPGR